MEAEKVFDKIQYSFLLKTQQSRNKTFHLVEDATKTATAAKKDQVHGGVSYSAKPRELS